MRVVLGFISDVKPLQGLQFPGVRQSYSRFKAVDMLWSCTYCFGPHVPVWGAVCVSESADLNRVFCKLKGCSDLCSMYNS